MKPYYEHAGITIYHGDCREIAPALTGIEAVITDPPYGIDWRPRVNHVGDKQLWHDTEKFDPVPWLSIGSVHLFWGAQYFSSLLPVSESWLAWVKRPIDMDFSNDERTYATMEIAWTDFKCKPAFYSQVWDGGMRAGEAQNRTFCHPSQKPVELMRWSIRKSKAKGLILDPFMGSGTTLVAAKDLGLSVVGIEVEEKYCELAVKRLSQEVLPLGAS